MQKSYACVQIAENGCTTWKKTYACTQIAENGHTPPPSRNQTANANARRAKCWFDTQSGEGSIRGWIVVYRGPQPRAETHTRNKKCHPGTLHSRSLRTWRLASRAPPIAPFASRLASPAPHIATKCPAAAVCSTQQQQFAPPNKLKL
ncbi:unnamed protein product [Ectocarpus sp. 6 AP-2014]